MAYLYGASIQGIQGFIFETNRLKEIVGASDLVEKFSSKNFIENFLSEKNIENYKLLRNAAGNIRMQFNDINDIKKVVNCFPQYIMLQAYGITLSQAVVKYEDQDDYIDKKNELEYSLIKARNQATLPLDSKFSLMSQTRRTAKPATNYVKYNDKEHEDEYFDKGNYLKFDNAEKGRGKLLLTKVGIPQEKHKKYPIMIDQISNKNSKIAVVHADGNNMGLMLRQMDDAFRENKITAEDIQEAFKEFSTQIENATKDAVQTAFENNFFPEDEIVPFRPVVIGGDDLTVICHADQALKFTKDYLKAFEENTKLYFKKLVEKYKLTELENGLSACAGISFCNKKFPFHYAVELAGKLCSYAKEESKRKSSCLMFHNIQSSYFTDYKRYIKNELTTKDNISLVYGPYFTKGKNPTIDALLEVYKRFSDDDIPLGKFREWLRELHKNKEYAKLFLERIDAVIRSKQGRKKHKELNDALGKLDSKLSLTTLISNNKTPMHDILQLKSVLGGKA